MNLSKTLYSMGVRPIMESDHHSNNLEQVIAVSSISDFVIRLYTSGSVNP